MVLKASKKVFENYKSEYPSRTIEKIATGFKNIGLDINYFPIDGGLCYSGRAQIAKTSYGTNGKGLTPTLAKASAFAELAERLSAGMLLNISLSSILDRKDYIFKGVIRDPDLLHKYVNFSFLDGYQSASYNEIISKVPLTELFSEYQLDDCELDALINMESSRHWVTACSLMSGNDRAIPIKLIRRISGSNGLASGNSIEEAIVQATCEIFERHSLLWAFKESPELPDVDISSVHNDKLLALISLFQANGFIVRLKDLSMGNTLPVVGVLFINKNIENDKNDLKRDLYHKRLHLGSGLNITDAFVRCFTEELQGLSLQELKYRSSADKLWSCLADANGTKYSPCAGSLRGILNYDYLRPDLSNVEEIGTFKRLDELVSFESDDFLKDIEFIKGICKRLNKDLLVLDMTHPILQFPTVRVIIPGMSNTIDCRLEGRSPSLICNDEVWFNAVFVDGIYTHLVDDNWITIRNRVIDVKSKLEEHLDRWPHNYQLNLGAFGLTQLNLFELLFIICAILGQGEAAEKYLKVIEETMGSSARKDYEVFFEQRDIRSSIHFLEKHLLSSGNPFFNSCPCQSCHFDLAETNYKMVRSYFH